MIDKSKPAVGAFGKAVARHLQARRAHQQITQQQLSTETEISQSQLSKQLRGLRAISIDEFELICAALNIEMEDILRLAEDEMTNEKVTQLRPRIEQTGAPSVDAKQYDEDAILDGINAGTEKFAAQEATDPLDENYT